MSQNAPVVTPAVLLQERRSDDQCLFTESKRNQAVLTDLRRATQYEVQVRARTLAGYGSFSPAAIFRTLPDGEEDSPVPPVLPVRGFLCYFSSNFPACVLSSRAGHDAASQFLVPGILIAVGMLLLISFVFAASYCIR